VELKTVQSNKFSFLIAGDTMGKTLLESEWVNSSLGAIENWPLTLKNALAILFHSKAPAILFWTDEYFTFYNDAFHAACVLPADERIGKKAHQIWQDRYKEIKPFLDELFSTNEYHMLDSRYSQIFESKTSGYDATFTISPLLNDDAEKEGVLIFCTQVSTSNEAEVKARLAIDSACLGTYEVDLKTDRMVTSERFNQIWGLENGIHRHQFISLIHPLDVSIRKKAHDEALISGNLDYEVRVRRDDKNFIWVRVKGRVLMDSEGKPSLLVGVIQDITEHKVFADELSKQVQERTQELQALNEELVATNEELSEANTNLVKANGELEQFAYVASHDLQEPLRKIQVFTNILQDRYMQELSENASTYLSKINSSAVRMTNLIKDLLDYSRLTHNKSLFQKVDLNKTLANVIDDFEVLIKQKKIYITIDALPVVSAIPIQMNQLFYNLVGNSIKFAKKTDEPFIRVCCEEISEEDRLKFPALKKNVTYHRIKVIDNGIGFSPEYAEQIFTIFQRLNDKSKYGGYGIGLALCKRIVHNHYGLIWASGQENIGATFTVILPQEH
jgi:PAS domain S-box-containing protein